MNIGIKQGEDLKQYWIAKQGLTEFEAETKLLKMRGLKSVYVGHKSALDDLGNTYYN